MDATIRELIRAIVGDARTYAIRATVTSVNGNTCNVSPLNGGAEIPDVKLITNSGNGLVITPAINSIVEVVKDGPFTAFVAQYSEIESITLDVSTTIVINGGANDGLVNVNDLVTKLNNLENKVNDLITYTATHTHTGVTTGAGTSGTSATPVTGTLTPTTANEIEDPNVTH